MRVVSMSKIIIPGEPTEDSIKYKKDCPDFQCMEDGTITRECKYCQLSTDCRQTGKRPDGVWANMKNDYVPIMDLEEGMILEWEYFCTGMFPEEDRGPLDDDEAS